MFLLFGITTRMKTVATGLFSCPNEGGDRPFRHVVGKRWFTLFFIPVIPMGTTGEHVRCESCGALYGADVVARHPARG